MATTNTEFLDKEMKETGRTVNKNSPARKLTKMFKVNYLLKEWSPIQNKYVEKVIHSTFVKDEQTIKTIKDNFEGPMTKITYWEVK